LIKKKHILIIVHNFTNCRIKKAKVAWPMLKSAPFGLPYSFADIRSSHLDEGIAVMMHTPSYRIATEQWPVYLASRYYYQLGPFSSEALSVLINALN
jgi:hypothetical protein